VYWYDRDPSALCRRKLAHTIIGVHAPRRRVAVIPAIVQHRTILWTRRLRFRYARGVRRSEKVPIAIIPVHARLPIGDVSTQFPNLCALSTPPFAPDDWTRVLGLILRQATRYFFQGFPGVFAHTLYLVHLTSRQWAVEHRVISTRCGWYDGARGDG